MKKYVIAGAGVAALGVAALPFAGVFAHTDTVTVNVPMSCSMSASDTTYNIGDATVGTAQIQPGTAMTVTCNKAGWKISAVGSNDIGSDVTAMTGSAGGTIATADDEGTSISNWGFSLAKTGSGLADITTGYTGYKAIPSTTTIVVTGGAPNGNTTTITPKYRVFVASGQAAGLYTGKVTYTFTQPAAS